MSVTAPVIIPVSTAAPKMPRHVRFPAGEERVGGRRHADLGGRGDPEAQRADHDDGHERRRKGGDDLAAVAAEAPRERRRRQVVATATHQTAANMPTASSTPGRMPATKRSMIEVFETSPWSMSGIEGGISAETVEKEALTAAAKPRG